MQRSKVEKIKLEWGDDPCNHPKIVKECYGNTLTGYIICAQCGRPIYNSAKSISLSRKNTHPPEANK